MLHVLKLQCLSAQNGSHINNYVAMQTHVYVQRATVHVCNDNKIV